MKKIATLSHYFALCCVISVMAAVQVAMADSPLQKPDLTAHASSGTAFIYQGQLRDASGPVNGTFDVRFSLYTTQTSGPALQSVEYEGLALTNGLFSLQLDFGPTAQEPSEGWLEVAVRPAGSADSYAVLSPRQKLTSTPYAILAQSEPWSLIGVPVGFGGKATEAVAADDTSSPSVFNEEAVAEPSIKNINAGKNESGSAEPMIAASPQATQNFIAKFDNRGQPFTDSIMFDNGTNVGIGTTNPTAKLHIDGTGIDNNGSTAVVRIVSGNGAQNLLLDGNEIDAVADGLFLNNNTNQNVMLATGGGNVGVGTTSPSAKLSITATGNGARVLLLGTERAWVFKQLRTGAATALELTGDNPNNNNKNFVINTDGNVGIGTINPGFKLDVAGTIRANNVSPSDARLKTNVTPLMNALDKLEQVRGVAFEWNERSESLGYSRGQKDIGVIAQEVETVFPELVNTSRTDGYKAVDYSRLTAVLIEAVKELKAGNEALKAENEALRTRLDALEQLVQKLARTQE